VRRALAVDERTFGPNHPNVATCLNNLAALLHDTNRIEQAELLYRRALAIDEQNFGESDPKVATCHNNLAQLLEATRRLQEAEPLEPPKQSCTVAAGYQPARGSQSALSARAGH
jgi:tetratricopeptide (TPR) repeat protein